MSKHTVEVIDNQQQVTAVTKEILADDELLSAAKEHREWLVVHLEWLASDTTLRHIMAIIRDNTGRIITFSSGCIEEETLTSGWTVTRESEQGNGHFHRIYEARIKACKKAGVTQIRVSTVEDSLGAKLTTWGFTQRHSGTDHILHI